MTLIGKLSRLLTRTVCRPSHDHHKAQRVVGEIIESIRKGETAVLCGAGISFGSGLPIADEFISCVLEKLPARPEERKAIREAVLPFELFMQTLFKNSDVDSLLNVFSECIDLVHLLMSVRSRIRSIVFRSA